MHRCHYVEALNEQALALQVYEAHRTDNGVHTFLYAILAYLIQQSLADSTVINKVEPAEAHILLVPPLVSLPVYNSSNTSHRFAVAISHVVFSVAEVKRRVLAPAQRVHLIHIQVRNCTRVILIQFCTEIDEQLQFPLCAYFSYL